jgi:hypothetical protein
VSDCDFQQAYSCIDWLKERMAAGVVALEYYTVTQDTSERMEFSLSPASDVSFTHSLPTYVFAVEDRNTTVFNNWMRAVHQTVCCLVCVCPIVHGSPSPNRNHVLILISQLLYVVYNRCWKETIRRQYQKGRGSQGRQCQPSTERCRTHHQPIGRNRS